VIDALIAGHLHGKPAERTAKSGKPFATVKVRAATRDGETLWVSVVAFEQGVIAALLGLADQDAVALAGELTVAAWLDKEGKPHPGLDLVAHQLVSPYSVARRRRAVRSSADPMRSGDTTPANGLIADPHAAQSPGDELSEVAPAPQSPPQQDFDDHIPF
jgi:single-stranded DNA-binding protein